MYKTIIIGENSNLSKSLLKQLTNIISISSRELSTSTKSLVKFKKEKVNIIFNNFQPAVMLNNISDPEKYIENSIGLTSKVLSICKENNLQINKLIYTSSSSVYGNNILCNEKDELKPMNLHASLKVANEKLIEKFCVDNHVDFTIARVFNMYGGDDNFSIVSKIIKAYKNQEELTIVNNGNAIRDFIHIEDIVDIYSKLLNFSNLPVLNIGTGEGNSVKNIIDLLHTHGKKLKTSNIYRDELKLSTADNRLLIEKLKVDKFISIENYLKKELNI